MTLAFLSLPSGAAHLLYATAAFSAALAVFGEARRTTCPELWRLIAAGLFGFAAGDIRSSPLAQGWHGEPWFASAEAFRVVAYLLLGTGLLMMSRARHARLDRAWFLDAVIISTAAGVVVWALVPDPLTHDALSVASPVIDAALLVTTVRLVGAGGARDESLGWLTGALAVRLVADVATLHLPTASSSEIRGLVDAVAVLSYILAAVAALRPPAADAGGGSAARPTPSGIRLLLLGLTAAISPGLVWYRFVSGDGTGVGLLALGSMVLFVFVVLRAAELIRDIERKAAELDAQRRRLALALAQKEELESRLRHQAFHDDLTGLANRALLLDRVEHALRRGHRTRERVALLFVDLDGFKAVNDRFGHAAGDELLGEVGRRLSECVRASDTVARLGGDEFAVLLEDVGGPEQGAEICHRIEAAMRSPFSIDGVAIELGASVGMALDEEDDADALLKAADDAMYATKRARKEPALSR